MALAWMPAKAYGGPLKPTVVVVHCTESDNGPGTAESLAGPNWFGGPAGTSAHKMFDQNSGVEMVKRTVVAYHAGPKGNTVGVSYEFCGRASWSAAKWREAPQLQMLRLAAPHIADDLRAMDAPARWLSLAQLATKAKGMCTHNDIRLALGGTTHSDPGPNFPYAELLAYVQAELTGTATTEDDMQADEREALMYLKGLMSWAFDPTLGKGAAFSTPGEITNGIGAIKYGLIPEDGFNSQGELTKRGRVVQTLVSDPAAFASALAPHLGGDVDQATVEAGVRAVLSSLGDAA